MKKDKQNSMYKYLSKIIMALDVENEKKAKKLVKTLSGVISFYKVGMELYLAAGNSLVKWLKKQGFKVFLDLKFYDVPETVKRATRQAVSLGVDFLTIHGNTDIMHAAVEGRDKTRLKLLAVTALTSLNKKDLIELGINCELSEFVLSRAKKAKEAGCDGVICSGMEAKMIREKIKKPFLIVTPGVRPKGIETADQKRVVTPYQAISGGADYIVVGRPIRDANNPVEKAYEIAKEIKEAL